MLKLARFPYIKRCAGPSGDPVIQLVRSVPARMAAVGAIFATISACASVSHAPAGPVEPRPTSEAVTPDLQYTSVWTARAEVPLFDGVARAYAVPRPFTRLDVVGQDSLGLRLLCTACFEPFEGYAAPEDLVVDYLPPEVAAWGELATFALAIRIAAQRHDINALRPAMHPDFSSSFVGIQTRETAIAAWESEQFAPLDRVAELLDQGLSTRDGQIWTAPLAFSEELGYQGLRIGFRRNVEGRWEWLFLVRGLVDR